MILPTGATRFEEAVRMGSETYHHLKVVIYLFIFEFLLISFSLFLIHFSPDLSTPWHDLNLGTYQV